MIRLKTFGSLCSGIEAASYVLKPLGLNPAWLSENAPFPSRFLSLKYPEVPNVGDMNGIPRLIRDRVIPSPDMLCGGTPCQAFSLAGWRKGISDERGQLTLRYIDILDTMDEVRAGNRQPRSIFFWENVEGALSDKTNAFGCFLAGLLGLDEPLVSPMGRWSKAGIVHGKLRNIAWRVLDAKYFGVPQQRRRVYVLGGGKDFLPESVLFEQGRKIVDPLESSTRGYHATFFNLSDEVPPRQLAKEAGGHMIEAFRNYSDCLYSAYGTKWNGNAAAYNGSLFFAQDGRLRRLSPLECERLMGFPDNYTLIPGCRDTQRYQAVGNSWAVPVIQWIMKRLTTGSMPVVPKPLPMRGNGDCDILMVNGFLPIGNGQYINGTAIPYDYRLTNMVDIADADTAEKFYITPTGCAGILRRKRERNMRMSQRLEEVLTACSNVQEYA